MNTNLKTTPLNPWHRQANANMADFGGYDMPLWYPAGVKNEHLAVLTGAGIFDTSHMAALTVNGNQAFDLLNFCFTRQLESLKTGRCVYGAFLNEKGHCIDDAIVYKFSDTSFMVCVNAGMGETVATHLQSSCKTGDVTIKDLTARVAKLDIQGIHSARILSKLIQNPETVFSQMPYFSFKGHFDPAVETKDAVRLSDDTPILLSRSGYTGEFGFEIFLSPKAIVRLWDDLLDAGQNFNITACGLGARDSLRAGACLPLSHQDIGHFPFINHPWEFALPFNKDRTRFTKKFLGSSALISSKNDRYVYPFAGDSLRKVTAGEKTGVFHEQKGNIGHVLTCATDMGITWHKKKIVSVATGNLPEDTKIKGIACGFVMVSSPLECGTKLTLTEGKRSISVTVVDDIRPDRTARKPLNEFI